MGLSHAWTVSAGSEQKAARQDGTDRRILNPSIFLREILSRLFWKIVKVAWEKRHTLGGSTILSQSLTSVMGVCGLASEKNSRDKCHWSIYPFIFIPHHKRIHAINVTEIFEQEF